MTITTPGAPCNKVVKENSACDLGPCVEPCVEPARAQTVYTGCGKTYRHQAERNTECCEIPDTDCGSTSSMVNDNEKVCDLAHGATLYTCERSSGLHYTYTTLKDRNSQCRDGEAEGPNAMWSETTWSKSNPIPQPVSTRCTTVPYVGLDSSSTQLVCVDSSCQQAHHVTAVSTSSSVAATTAIASNTTTTTAATTTTIAATNTTTSTELVGGKTNVGNNANDNHTIVANDTVAADPGVPSQSSSGAAVTGILVSLAIVALIVGGIMCMRKREQARQRVLTRGNGRAGARARGSAPANDRAAERSVGQVQANAAFNNDTGTGEDQDADYEVVDDYGGGVGAHANGVGGRAEDPNGSVGQADYAELDASSVAEYAQPDDRHQMMYQSPTEPYAELNGGNHVYTVNA